MIFSIRLNLFQNRLTKKFAVPKEKNYVQIFNPNPALTKGSLAYSGALL
jgi:hypothetical protein